MTESPRIDEILAERVALLEEASRTLASASATGRELTAAEDLHVLQLMKRAQYLDEEAARLRRRHGGERHASVDPE